MRNSRNRLYQRKKETIKIAEINKEIKNYGRKENGNKRSNRRKKPEC